MNRRRVLVVGLLLLALAALLGWKIAGARRRTGPGEAEAPRQDGATPAAAGDASGPGAGVDPAPEPAERRPHFIRGRVLRADGSPESRFGVAGHFAEGNNGQRPVRVSCDDRGAFEIPVDRGGPWAVQLASNGPQRGVTRIVDVPADGSVEGVEIRLPETWELRVRVVDGGGIPLPGAMVHVRTPQSYEGTTGPDGEALFGIGDGPEAHVFMWQAPPCERPVLRPLPVTVPRGTPTATLVAGAAGFAWGRAIGPDGAALPWADLVVRDGKNILSWCDTKEDGSFQIAVPIEGTCAIELDPTTSRLAGRLDHVRAGDRGLVLRVDAIPRDRGLTIVTRGPAGAAAGVRVEVHGRGEILEMDKTTGEDGRLVLEGLFRGPLKARAWTRETAESPLWSPPRFTEIADGQDSVELVLEEGRWFEVTLRLPGGVTPLSADVFVRSGDLELGRASGLGSDTVRVVLPAAWNVPVDVEAGASDAKRAFQGRASNHDSLNPAIIDLRPEE